MAESPTRAAVRALREAEPEISCTEIGRRLGISNTAARHHIRGLGLRPVTSTSYDPQRRRRTTPLAGPPVISNSARGGASELVAAADFMARGYEVFWSLHPTASCDFVIQRNGRLERVEVKTGRVIGNGGVRWNAPNANKAGDYDRLAVVVPGQPVMHRPPLE